MAVSVAYKWQLKRKKMTIKVALTENVSKSYSKIGSRNSIKSWSKSGSKSHIKSRNIMEWQIN